jgi:N-acetylglucosaminyldiphosphoundecaprenol N-acetyl-beta-D-mannosaminyltransferase
MPPSAAACTPAETHRLEIARSRLGGDGAATDIDMWFGAVPITETGVFPPPNAAHCWVYLTLNAEIALSMSSNPSLHELLRLPRARVSIDGQWLWWALRRKYPTRALIKLSGSDLVYELAALCARRQQRLLLLGSTPEVNALAVRRLRDLHPELAVCGFSPPSYRLGRAEHAGAAEAAALHAIEAHRPDYVVLGLGAEKEQRLALRLSPLLDGRVTGMLCFGGAIDMVSGEVRRASPWMRSLGVEALYRVCQQPRRLPRLVRVLRILPRLVARDY